MITPHPTSPIDAGAPAIAAAASAALAAVRAALMRAPSSSATGRPVSIEFRTITADARGRPRARLPGNDAIHLMPATGVSPPSWAARAIMRVVGSGRSRKVDNGIDDCPCSCSR